MSKAMQIQTARAAAAAAAFALSAAVLIAADRGQSAPLSEAPPRVSVVSSGNGAYRIEGSFHVDTPVSVAWAVLTDYNDLSSFVSSMRSSTAARQESGRLLVIQEATGRAGPFSRTMRVVLDVREEPPGRIEFRDLSGASFHSYVGAWAIDPDGAGARVSYSLRARPRSAPPLFARSLLGSNARGLLKQVRSEMLRRGHIAACERLSIEAPHSIR